MLVHPRILYHADARLDGRWLDGLQCCCCWSSRRAVQMGHACSDFLQIFWDLPRFLRTFVNFDWFGYVFIWFHRFCRNSHNITWFHMHCCVPGGASFPQTPTVSQSLASSSMDLSNISSNMTAHPRNYYYVANNMLIDRWIYHHVASNMAINPRIYYPTCW